MPFQSAKPKVALPCHQSDLLPRPLHNQACLGKIDQIDKARHGIEHADDNGIGHKNQRTQTPY